MSSIFRVELDVRKPHGVDVVQLATAIAEQGSDYQVRIIADAVDQRSERIQITVEGADLNCDAVGQTITSRGGVVEAITEVGITSSVAGVDRQEL